MLTFPFALYPSFPEGWPCFQTLNTECQAGRQWVFGTAHWTPKMLAFDWLTCVEGRLKQTSLESERATEAEGSNKLGLA